MYSFSYNYASEREIVSGLVLNGMSKSELCTNYNLILASHTLKVFTHVRILFSIAFIALQLLQLLYRYTALISLYSSYIAIQLLYRYTALRVFRYTALISLYSSYFAIQLLFRYIQLLFRRMPDGDHRTRLTLHNILSGPPTENSST